MTISKDIQRLEQHLAQYGLHAVAVESNTQPEVFKVCFLNKIELDQWEKQRQERKAANSGQQKN
ncbi:hypothetical protein GA0116948_10211 [Chitinophaga costaii]|uniref:Uncharacterized protein n=1 Tax=Chitinophaga costaii TaxID=1335309 RepID=A0A1C4A845_9BACT|nr:hypothetical protein [Chitinophaga costaii]PUZ26498.1 hypothetical protein DCM91_08755 [Chitinophaga costaii]SCB90746.1 hypothetical protein GA0116948_10211 [Chitinophaga costaii]